jgi:hypothetical protein
VKQIRRQGIDVQAQHVADVERSGADLHRGVCRHHRAGGVARPVAHGDEADFIAKPWRISPTAC